MRWSSANGPPRPPAEPSPAGPPVFFPLSKFYWYVSTPLHLLAIVLAVGALLLWTRRHRRLGRAIVSATVALLLAFALLPVGAWLMWPLATRFPALAEPPADLAGIVLLTGDVVNAIESEAAGQPVPGDNVDRLVEFLRLARLRPQARLVVTGGIGSLDRSRPPEAPWIAEYMVALGVPRGRILVETEARNTAENARFTKAMVQPAAGERWAVVTSAYHMPRSIGCFRGAGWEVLAAPSIPRVEERELWEPPLRLHRDLERIGTAMHEYVGLLAYRLNGYVPEVWPGPAGG